VHPLRKLHHLNVRQPLSKVVVPVISEKVRSQLGRFSDLVLGEVNVKELEFIADTTGILTLKIKPNFKTLGKVYGKRMKEIAAAFAGLDQATISAIQRSDLAGTDYTLALPEGDVVLHPDDYEISSEDMQGWAVATEGSLTVALDLVVTDELRCEGVARELVNRIQNLRKDSGFDITDWVDVVLCPGSADADLETAVASFKEYICAQTLARSLSIGPADGGVPVEWENGNMIIKVTR
jgi:isoleucyl-tRNA synthetase